MTWLLFCAFFLVMLFSIFRMLNRRGKWAWGVFLGLIASVLVYVGLVVLPLASSPTLDQHRTLLAGLLIGGTLVYAGALILVARKVGGKMRPLEPPK